MPNINRYPQEILQKTEPSYLSGSFKEKVWAVRLIKELDEKGYRAFIEETVIPKKGTWYRVAVGRFPSTNQTIHEGGRKATGLWLMGGDIC